MALTLPTVDDLYDAWGPEADTSDDNRAQELIQLSADLLWLATKIEDDPTDSRLANLVQWAIMDMAIYLYVNRDVIDETYSPFSGERIGNYSYSKIYSRVAKTVSMNDPTGVALFDRVVMELNDEYTYDTCTAGGQKIFAEQYLPLQWEVYGPYGHANQDAWPRV